MKLEVSNGELIDKYTILKIKMKNITSPDKLKFVERELNILSGHVKELLINHDELQNQIDELEQVNQTLWDIENAIRHKEALEDYDGDFISLARSVYINNDIRASIKLNINKTTNSELQEVKQYTEYSA